MKVGDLVCPYPRHNRAINWIGVVVATATSRVVIYWNDNYPDEVENKCDLEVISEGR